MDLVAIRDSITLAHFATRHSVALGRDQCCHLGGPVRYDLLRDWFGVRWVCRSRAKMPIMQEGPLRAAGAHDQADRDARDHALQVGASGRGTVRAQAQIR
jgi:hypothetical protein